MNPKTKAELQAENDRLREAFERIVAMRTKVDERGKPWEVGLQAAYAYHTARNALGLPEEGP